MHLKETLQAVVAGVAISMASCDTSVKKMTCGEINRKIQEVVSQKCPTSLFPSSSAPLCQARKGRNIDDLKVSLKEKQCK